MSDELKALVDVLRTVSGDTLSFAKWWLAYRVLGDIAATAVLMYLIHRVGRLVWGVINNGHVSKEIARHIGVDEDCDRYYADNRKIHAWVRKAIEREKGERG